MDQERFLKDVSYHGMQVIKEDGLYRHLRFKRPNTTVLHFDLITWPGYLAYTGDMGSYVFTRIPDMFDFFRQKDWDSTKRFQVDRRYLAEKAVAVDKSDGIEEWSPPLFRVRAVQEFDEWCESEGLSALEGEMYRKELAGFLRRPMEDPKEAYKAVMEWKIRGKRPLEHFYEVNTMEFSYRFDWCCMALVWGIATYDRWVKEALTTT